MAGTTLQVLSAGAVKGGVSQVVKAYEQASGQRAAVRFQTAPELRELMASGAAADVIVAPPGLMDELARDRKIDAATRGFVGRSRVGVVVHAQAASPEIGDTAAFTRTLRAAPQVVHNRASSGIYIAKLLVRLGLAEELAARIVQVDGGAAIMEHVAAHPGAVGLAQISEVMVLVAKGCAVRLAGPLPDEIQNETRYDVAAIAGAPPAAHDLARELASERAKQVFAATGIN